MSRRTSLFVSIHRHPPEQPGLSVQCGQHPGDVLSGHVAVEGVYQVVLVCSSASATQKGISASAMRTMSAMLASVD